MLLEILVGFVVCASGGLIGLEIGYRFGLRQCAEYAAALRFYGAEETYKVDTSWGNYDSYGNPVNSGKSMPIDRDNGTKARAALLGHGGLLRASRFTAR